MLKDFSKGLYNHINSKKLEESENKMNICLTPENDDDHCSSLINVNDSLFGPRCGKCGCILKIMTKSEKKCPRKKW